jgi:anthranilate synthase component 1
MITSYFGPKTGLGLALRNFPRQRNQRIGLLGLGVGSIAAYGKPGDYLRIYEINPHVRDIAAKPFTYLAGSQARTEVVRDGQVIETASGNPLDFIEAYQKRFKVALRPGLPRFCGGLAGYFGYDTVRHIEKKLEASCPPDTLGCPDILLLQCEELAVIDNLSGKLYLIVYADPGQGEAYANGKKRLRDLKDLLRYSVSAPAVKATPAHEAEREFAKADYLRAVEKAKDLIAAGDFMQVQVGQRIKKRFAESPLSLYRALRSLNPSPYMYYYNFSGAAGSDFHVVGASPEILVRQEQTPAGQKVTIRPLAGTRPRGATPEVDKATEHELLADPKERAEHVMLIDLARNDIGRIAQTGSVKVCVGHFCRPLLRSAGAFETCGCYIVKKRANRCMGSVRLPAEVPHLKLDPVSV